MFGELRSAVATLEGVARDLDPGVLDGSDAATLLDVVARGERTCAAMKALLAARVDATGVWRQSGARTAAHWLANRTGVGLGQAIHSLDTVAVLDQLPATAAAFRAGALSEAQAFEIIGAASADPGSEARLLETAQRRPLKGLKDDCREVLAVVASQADDVAWARRLNDSRFHHSWKARDGAVCGEYRLAPDAGARWLDALKGHEHRIFRDARSAGRRELRDAYSADALVALACEGPCKPVEVGLLLDHAALIQGHVAPGQRCEIKGVGPIPVTMAGAMLDDAAIAVMVRDGTDVTIISRLTRVMPAALRRWLEQAYPECGRSACSNTFGLQNDHIIPVEKHGPTEKHNLWRLCPHCHNLKHVYNWQIIGEYGNWDLVPPDRSTDNAAGPDPP